MLIILNRLKDVLTLTREEPPAIKLLCSLAGEELMAVCIFEIVLYHWKKFPLTFFTDGLVTNSQLFPFTEGQTDILLAPENGNNATCLVANAAGKLDSTTCAGDATSQSFTILTA